MSNYPAGVTESDIEARFGGDQDPRDHCPNCDNATDFKECSSHHRETHGLDCGPYEEWNEEWLECRECRAQTNPDEVARHNMSDQDYKAWKERQ